MAQDEQTLVANARPARKRGSGHIVVRATPGNPTRGTLRWPGGMAPAALGRTGISAAKHEGDGHTPAGTFGVVGVLYRRDRIPRPQTRLPVFAIGPEDGWCDDPTHRDYNREIRLPHPASHERLWRDDHVYDIVVVIDFNLAHPRPGGGSAIFLHLAMEDFSPTAGCLAVSRATMLKLLPTLLPGSTITIG